MSRKWQKKSKIRVVMLIAFHNAYPAVNKSDYHAVNKLESAASNVELGASTAVALEGDCEMFPQQARLQRPRVPPKHQISK